jgi:hypothetical protein
MQNPGSDAGVFVWANTLPLFRAAPGAEVSVIGDIPVVHRPTATSVSLY